MMRKKQPTTATAHNTARPTAVAQPTPHTLLQITLALPSQQVTYQPVSATAHRLGLMITEPLRELPGWFDQLPAYQRRDTQSWVFRLEVFASWEESNPRLAGLLDHLIADLLKKYRQLRSGQWCVYRYEAPAQAFRLWSWLTPAKLGEASEDNLLALFDQVCDAEDQYRYFKIKQGRIVPEDAERHGKRSRRVTAEQEATRAAKEQLDLLEALPSIQSVFTAEEQHRRAVAQQVAPILSQFLKEAPQETLFQKQVVCRMVNFFLKKLGLAIECPRTGKASILRADRGREAREGRFQIVNSAQNGKQIPTVSSADLAKLFAGGVAAESSTISLSLIPEDWNRSARAQGETWVDFTSGDRPPRTRE